MLWWCVWSPCLEEEVWVVELRLREEVDVGEGQKWSSQRLVVGERHRDVAQFQLAHRQVAAVHLHTVYTHTVTHQLVGGRVRGGPIGWRRGVVVSGVRQ